MPRLKKPWQMSKKVLKKDESCIDGKPHRLRMVSLTRTDADSLPNGHIKSKVVYQCVVCNKYQIDRYVYPKIQRVPT